LANTTDFVQYASQAGALVEAQATYVSDPQTALGQQDGIADPANANKAWRQGAAGTAALMQITANALDVNVPDDGNLPNLIGQLWAGFLNNSSFPDTGAINALVAALPFGAIFPVSALQPGTLITVIPSVTNTGPATLNFALTGPKSIKLPSGVDPDSGDIIAGTTVRLCYDGTHWEMVSVPGRLTTILVKATTSLSYFVNPVTGNNANDGLTTGTAWQTLSFAYSWLQTNIDANSQVITINCAFPNNPTAYATATFNGGITGVFTPSQLLIVGDTTNQHCSITATGGATCIMATNGAMGQITGFTLSGGVAGLQCGTGSQINVGSMVFGATADYALSAARPGSIIIAVGPLTFSGNALSLIHATFGGLVQADGETLNFNTLTVSVGTITVTDVGMVSFGGTTMNHVGTVTGPRFAIGTNGIMDTDGAQALVSTNFVPGSSNGTTATGGQFA
jgi:hypothetical protein